MGKPIYDWNWIMTAPLKEVVPYMKNRLNAEEGFEIMDCPEYEAFYKKRGDEILKYLSEWQYKGEGE